MINSIQSPSFGLNEPEVKQENLAAGISKGIRNCLHLDFFVITPTPGTTTVILSKLITVSLNHTENESL